MVLLSGSPSTHVRRGPEPFLRVTDFDDLFIMVRLDD